MMFLEGPKGESFHRSKIIKDVKLKLYFHSLPPIKSEFTTKVPNTLQHQTIKGQITAESTNDL
jgi:hypothetical protein